MTAYPHIFSEEQLAGMVSHMNEDHADSVLLYVQAYSQIQDATAARLVSVDAEGMDIEAALGAGAETQAVRIPFDKPLKDSYDAHVTLVQMSKAARKKVTASET
ncbi:MAG: DUF2470 domain-containing protein [Opitutales bacterium]